MVESNAIDRLDRQIAHALGLNARAPFSQIGEVLGVSDQTVARRYRRLRAHGVLRPVGLCDHRRTGGSRWWVRLQCQPGAAPGIATALASHPGTTWVQLLAGGTELLCSVHSVGPERESEPLLEKLPRSGRITAITAQLILHLFAGGALAKGAELLAGLTPEQVAALTPPPPPPLADEPVPLDDRDLALFAELALDGRASYAALAAATGWSESSVRRRIDQLQDLGVLYSDLEIDVGVLGLRTQAWLWLDVQPARLSAVGEALADWSEVVFAAASTGPTNLAAAVCCRDSESLYHFLSTRIGPLEGVRHVETVPVVRTVKQGGTVVRH